jgi:hypothetical protein
MRRTTRTTILVVTTLVAVLSVLVLGGTATAKPQPQRGPSIAKERQLALKAIALVDTAVGRATDVRRLRGLDPDTQAGVVANADLDRADLDAMADQVALATTRTEVRTAVVGLRAFKSANYAVATAALRSTARLSAEVETARETYADDATALEQVDAADLLVQDAAALALEVRATSDRTALRGVTTAVAAANRAVGALDEL